jgi:hypothetical protein
MPQVARSVLVPTTTTPSQSPWSSQTNRYCPAVSLAIMWSLSDGPTCRRAKGVLYGGPLTSRAGEQASISPWPPNMIGSAARVDVKEMRRKAIEAKYRDGLGILRYSSSLSCFSSSSFQSWLQSGLMLVVVLWPASLLCAIRESEKCK